jgi:hypothetical protein
MAGSKRSDVVPTTKPQRWPLMVVVAASVYAIWFAWLAYVAWVNVSAGNQ